MLDYCTRERGAHTHGGAITVDVMQFEIEYLEKCKRIKSNTFLLVLFSVALDNLKLSIEFDMYFHKLSRWQTIVSKVIMMCVILSP